MEGENTVATRAKHWEAVMKVMNTEISNVDSALFWGVVVGRSSTFLGGSSLSWS